MIMQEIIKDKENDKQTKSVLNISPGIKQPIKPSFQKIEVPYVLVCSKFQESLHIDFGRVAVKSTKNIQFTLHNPSKQKSVKVSVDRLSEKSGITVILDSSDTKSAVIVDVNGSKVGTIYWCPSNDCTMRSVIHLKMDDRAPLQIVVNGIAGSGMDNSTSESTELSKVKVQHKKKTQIPSSAAVSSVLSPERKTMPKASGNKVTFSSPDRGVKTQQVRSPLLPTKAASATAKSPTHPVNHNKPVTKKAFSIALGGNNWAEKQAANFKDWLNYTFQKSQDSLSVCVLEMGDSNNDEIKNPESTIKNSDSIPENQRYASSFKQILQKRADALARQRGQELFRDEGFQSNLISLKNEIESGRLAIREDRDIHADLGQQELFFDLIFSYELPWLKLGLETLTGQVISVNMHAKEGKIGRVRLAFKSFILETIFSDRSIMDHFGKHKLLYIAQERKLKEALRRHMLTSTLTLVLFLDAAKARALLKKSTLFLKDSSIKSSKDVLTNLCRILLKGEGDIIRHLQLIGYSLTYTQAFVDEYDYPVRNLALDLRDGVRLVKVYELLTGSKTLTDQLRVPAVSRLQKLHNVSLILNALYKGADMRPNPKQIVDGQRDVTLALLWRLLYEFELRMLIQPDRVLEEVQTIRRSRSWRRSIYSRSEAEQFSVRVLLYDDVDLTQQGDDKSNQVKAIMKTHTMDEASMEDMQDLANLTSAKEDVKLSAALMRWVRAICEQYQVPVFDFTTCLADGRALCLLVHYYHPSILPTRSIRKTTAHLIQDHLRKQQDLTGSNKKSPRKRLDSNLTLATCPLNVPSADLMRALSGERKNFSLLKRACQHLGGIPLMLPEDSSYDSRNLPEEKTMVLFLGFLFSRLTESASQVSAALLIQKRFRSYLVRKKRSKIAFEKPSQSTELKISEFANENYLAPIQETFQEDEKDFDETPANTTYEELDLSSNEKEHSEDEALEEDEHEPFEDEDTNEKREERSFDAMEDETREHGENFVVEQEDLTLNQKHVEDLAFDQFEEECDEDLVNEQEEEEDEEDFVVEEEGKDHGEDLENEQEKDEQVQNKSESFVDGANHHYVQAEENFESEEDFFCDAYSSEINEQNRRKRAQATIKRAISAFISREKTSSVDPRVFAEMAPMTSDVASPAPSNASSSVNCTMTYSSMLSRSNSTKKLPHFMSSSSASPLSSPLDLVDYFVDSHSASYSQSSDDKSPGILVPMTTASRSFYIRDKHRDRLEEVQDNQLRLSLLLNYEGEPEKEDGNGDDQGEYSQIQEEFPICDEAIDLSEEVEMDDRLSMAQIYEFRDNFEFSASSEELQRIGSSPMQAIHTASTSSSPSFDEVHRTRSNEESFEEQVPLVCKEGLSEEEIVWMRRMADEVKLREELELRLFRETTARRSAELKAKQAQENNLTLTSLLEESLRQGAEHNSLPCIENESHQCEETVAEVNTNGASGVQQHPGLMRLQALVRGRQLRNSQDLKQKQEIRRVQLLQQELEEQEMIRAAQLQQEIEKQRCEQNKMEVAAIKLTSWAAMLCARKAFLCLLTVRSTSRLLLQRSARVFLAKKTLHCRQRSVIRIQTFIASAMRRRKYRRTMRIFCRMVPLIRKWIGRHRAARNIQRMFRSRRPILRIRKMLKGFCRLLAVRRSKLIKRRVTCPKVAALAEKIKQSAQRARSDPSMRLGRQTQAALAVLANANGRMISQVLRACQVLELSTQFSKLCCVSFAEAAASNVLFALLRSCNRSTPHQELLRISLVILLHVGRHPSLAPLVAQSEDCCDVLVDLMQMFRDKKSIFVLASELLSRLIHASPSVKSMCNSPLYRKRLEGILSIIERKIRMEAKVKNVITASTSADALDLIRSDVKVRNITSVGGDSAAAENNRLNSLFGLYKTQSAMNIEPIFCMQHLLRLLQ